MPIPAVELLHQHRPALAEMVANTSWLPNQTAITHLGRAVFPTSRAKAKHPRFSLIEENGAVVGMYDDNATPEWALFWAHGLQGTRPKGWTVAHVWSASDDIKAYTHVANLALIPEPLASLTDKNGPLTGYLRWHSWEVYGWKPDRAAEPAKPADYDQVKDKWRYLAAIEDPQAWIRQRFNMLDNQRTRILRPIMHSRETP